MSTLPDITTADKALYAAIFQPRSIALYGASGDARKTSARPMQYLRRAGWPGRLYPINPRRETVLGERAWPSLASIDEVPDHVFVLTDSAMAVAAVAECVDLGVPVVTVLANDFGEAGPEGKRRQDQLVARLRGGETRMIGPSSLGAANLVTGLLLTANAAFADAPRSSGGTFVASQSGGIIGALLSRGRAGGVPFAGLISTGGEADLSLGEICRLTLADERIESYALFLEALGNVQDLRAFAIEAAAAGRPVLAYKLGRSMEGAKLSASHTGRLAGDDLVANEVLADMGIARVLTLDALIEGQALGRRLPPAASGKRVHVGVVTSTGGGGAMVVDQLALKAVDVHGPAAPTRAALAEVGVHVSDAPLIDVTLAGANTATMHACLRILVNAPEFDVVVAVAGSSAQHQPELVVEPIVRVARDGAPITAFVTPDAPEALHMLAQAGVSAFRTPESCADAVHALVSRRPAQARPEYMPAAAGYRAVSLDERTSYDFLDKLGVPHAPYVTTELKRPLTTKPFAGRVVVKALGTDLPHKSDLGLVRLSVGTDAQLEEATRAIRRNASAAGRPDITQGLIQPMVEAVAEVLIGYRIDPVAGPVVVLAPGGIHTEMFDERSIRLAPVTVEVAREMIADIKPLKTLHGFRGAPPGDIEALAAAIAALSRAAARPELAIVEAEVNPILVLAQGQGVVAVDALVIQRGTRTETGAAAQAS